jgi:hypothetical protein
LYLADFYALKREEDEALLVFNRRFYNTYHDMPLEIQPTETVAMVYYVMGLHSELSLLLLERKSSSLRQLFEDAEEVEENICASRRIRDRDCFENLHAHEQEECQYSSYFEQEGNECEADLEQQQACEIISDSDLNSSTFAEYSRDRYACEFYNQFANHVEHVVTDDCIGNYMFLADHNPCHLNTALSSSYDHDSEERQIAIFYDHKLLSREQEIHQSSSKEVVMVEQVFSLDQHVYDLSFKDPVAAFMESYISENLKISDFLSSPMFPGEYGFLNKFLSLLLYFRYHLLIGVMDKIFSVLKLLEWLLWKSAFT